MTFCLFAKHFHIDMLWFGIFLWMYRDKHCIQEDRSYHTLYTSREIDWFRVKDNIKIEGYMLKFWTVEKLFFSLFSNYHDWKNLVHTIFYHKQIGS